MQSRADLVQVSSASPRPARHHQRLSPPATARRGTDEWHPFPSPTARARPALLKHPNAPEQPAVCHVSILSEWPHARSGRQRRLNAKAPEDVPDRDFPALRLQPVQTLPRRTDHKHSSPDHRTARSLPPPAPSAGPRSHGAAIDSPASPSVSPRFPRRTKGPNGSPSLNPAQHGSPPAPSLQLSIHPLRYLPSRPLLRVRNIPGESGAAGRGQRPLLPTRKTRKGPPIWRAFPINVPALSAPDACPSPRAWEAARTCARAGARAASTRACPHIRSRGSPG